MDENRISFDFDGVLSREVGQELAKLKIKQGFEVWIVTARRPDRSEKVFEIAKLLNIPESRIVFTSGRDKWKFIDEFDIGLHYDNNEEQINKIKEFTEANARFL